MSRKMTPQEAIQRIKKHNEIHSRAEKFAIYITEALNMGIDALEKQIPKKPKKIGEEYINGRWETDYECSSCGNPYIDDSFCSCCGQALDWSDSE